MILLSKFESDAPTVLANERIMWCWRNSYNGEVLLKLFIDGLKSKLKMNVYFQKLPSGLILSCKEGRRPENATKTRYREMYACKYVCVHVD